MVKENPEMKEFVDKIDYKPLNPRDAFFGGRTNAVRLLYDAKDNEKIKYVDVCSLYPWVNKYGRYPIGHPIIVTENFQPWHKYEGFIKCKVLPPKDLLHPVLPYRSNKKLMFPLCATCADTRQTTTCTHTDEERAIVGSWVSLEIQKAFEKGYKVQELYEVRHFEEHTQYNPQKKEGGLFAEYVNAMLKMKQEASGFPVDCNSDEDRLLYIKDYMRREGVKLEKIEKNPGMRCLAKLMLNSFWGKFGQRNNLQNKVIINDLRMFWEMVEDPTTEININRIDEDSMELSVLLKDEFVESTGNKNIYIAAYTTAQARLKLYSYLELLGDRVLYFDTDSIIYISRDGEYDVPLGNYLGDMTDELEKDYGPGSYITRFASGGPKNYAYEVYSTKTGEKTQTCKVRGITLTADVEKLVNFETMRSMIVPFVDKEETEPIVVRKEHDIVREGLGRIFTKPTKKTYRIVYDKRVIRPDYTTVPYGYG